MALHRGAASGVLRDGEGPGRDVEPRRRQARPVPVDEDRAGEAEGRPSSTPGAVDEEEKKKLQALGYLSSGATAGPGPLPDPKDEIGLIRTLNEAMGHVRAGRPGPGPSGLQGAPRPEPPDDRRLGALLRGAQGVRPPAGGPRGEEEAGGAGAAGGDARADRRCEPLSRDGAGRRGAPERPARARAGGLRPPTRCWPGSTSSRRTSPWPKRPPGARWSAGGRRSGPTS